MSKASTTTAAATRVAAHMGRELAAYNNREADRLCAAFERTLRKQASALDAAVAASMLEKLQRRGAFPLVQRLAQTFLETGCDSFEIRRRYAQALIELGMLAPAVALLEPLAGQHQNHREAQEAAGLLGRARKQAFINTGVANVGGKEAFLAALDHYHQAYRQVDASLDVRLWTGINTVALLARAARARLGLVAGAPDPEELARQLLAAIATVNKKAATPWTYATEAEAQLALHQHDRALLAAKELIAHPDTGAFHIGSLLRQATEVWQLDREREPGRTLLPLLEGALGQKGGATLVFDAQKLRTPVPPLGQRYERIFGHDLPSSFQWLRQAAERLRLVGRIQTLGTAPLGTGFLIRARDCRARIDSKLPDGEVLLMTNGHVVGDGEFSADNAEVLFQALDPESDKTVVGVRRVLWTSHRHLDSGGLDASLLQLRWAEKQRRLLAELTFPAIGPFQRRTDGPNRVYVIGHPGGRELSISLHDSLVVGQDDKRLHYRTPTEAGSSGSPVFDHDWRLVALHHMGGDQLERRDGKKGVYEANEGVRIEAVLDRGGPRTTRRSAQTPANGRGISVPPLRM